MDKSLLKSQIRKLLKEALTPDQVSKVEDKYNSIYSGMLKGNKKKLMKYVDPKFNRPNPDAMAMGRAINLVKKDTINEEGESWGLETRQLADSFTFDELEQLLKDNKISKADYNGAISYLQAWVDQHPTYLPQRDLDTSQRQKVRSHFYDIKESFNETLKLGVKYELPTGETGYIMTGGSDDPRDWMFKKQPYLSVEDKLKPASKQPGKYDGAFDMGHGKGHHIDEESVNERLTSMVREVYSEKQRKWACAQKNPKFDEMCKDTAISKKKLKGDVDEGRMKDPSKSIKMGGYPQVSSDVPIPMNVKYLTTNGEKLTVKVKAKNRKEAVDVAKSKDPNFKAEIKTDFVYDKDGNKLVNEERTSTVSKSRAKSELKQMLQGYRDDGMGKSTLKAVLAIDKDGKETKIKKLKDFSKFEKGTKFALKETTMEKKLTEDGPYPPKTISDKNSYVYQSLRKKIIDITGKKHVPGYKVLGTLRNGMTHLNRLSRQDYHDILDQNGIDGKKYDEELQKYFDDVRYRRVKETTMKNDRLTELIKTALKGPVKEDKDWIQKAIKRPGALHRELGVPKDKDIPKSLINKTIKKLKKKDKDDEEEGTQLGAADERELRQLNLAKTLSKFNKNKLTERVFKKLREAMDDAENGGDVGLKTAKLKIKVSEYGELYLSNETERRAGVKGGSGENFDDIPQTPKQLRAYLEDPGYKKYVDKREKELVSKDKFLKKQIDKNNKQREDFRKTMEKVNQSADKEMKAKVSSITKDIDSTVKDLSKMSMFESKGPSKKPRR